MVLFFSYGLPDWKRVLYEFRYLGEGTWGLLVSFILVDLTVYALWPVIPHGDQNKYNANTK